MRQQEIQDILIFLQRSKGLESAKRYGSSLRDEQNTVAAHSWRLALMALVIGEECKVRININHAVALALIHDLAEAKTGDLDAYAKITGGTQSTKNKSVLEEAAMREMTSDLSFGGSIYGWWREYEDQTTMEAKFVCALDRIEGFLHIAEGGVEMYIPKEFHADYANKAVAAFDEATHHFPELKDLLDVVKKNLREQFKRVGVKWIDGVEETPTAVEGV